MAHYKNKEETIQAFKRELAAEWAKHAPTCDECGFDAGPDNGPLYSNGRGKTLCKECLTEEIERLATARYDRWKKRGAILVDG